jgi:hypothetical protein
MSHAHDESRTNLSSLSNPRYLRLKAEFLIAGQRAVRCYDLNRAGGGAGRHRGGDFGLRNHRERRRGTVKRDARRARQIGSQNLDVCSYRAGSGQCFHERVKAHGQAEDRAIVARPAIVGDPVEGPIRGLNQRAGGLLAVSHIEAVQRGQGASCRDAKDGATGLTE